MNSHCSDAEFAEALLAGTPPAHTAECETCRREWESISGAIGSFRQAAREDAARPEVFWAVQRAQIRSRLPRRGVLAGLRGALVTGLLVCIFAVMLFLPGRNHKTRISNTTANAAHPALSDDALLRQVDEAVTNDTPAAMEPTALMASEMNAALSGSSQSTGAQNQ